MKGVCFLGGWGQAMTQHNRYEFLDATGGVLGLKVERLVLGEWLSKDHYCVCVCVDHHLYHKENKKSVKWIKNRSHLMRIQTTCSPYHWQGAEMTLNSTSRKTFWIITFDSYPVRNPRPIEFSITMSRSPMAAPRIIWERKGRHAQFTETCLEMVWNVVCRSLEDGGSYLVWYSREERNSGNENVTTGK